MRRFEPEVVELLAAYDGDYSITSWLTFQSKATLREMRKKHGDIYESTVAELKAIRTTELNEMIERSIINSAGAVEKTLLTERLTGMTPVTFLEKLVKVKQDLDGTTQEASGVYVNMDMGSLVGEIKSLASELNIDPAGLLEDKKTDIEAEVVEAGG